MVKKNSLKYLFSSILILGIIILFVLLLKELNEKNFSETSLDENSIEVNQNKLIYDTELIEEDDLIETINEDELDVCNLELNGNCWKLDWSDEFDYEGLPNPTKWDYEEGFRREGRKQYYTVSRLENARVENGNLIIEARKEIFSNQRYNPNSNWWVENTEFANYTSASLITLNKKSFMYGKLEVRAKLPQGSGVWPAIWMMGSNKPMVGYPECGEIDIMEFVGFYPNRILSALHYELNGERDSQEYALWMEQPLNGFHLYSMEWYPDRFDFFFDNNKYYTFTIDDAGFGEENPYRKPNYLLINLALGAAGGEIDDSLFPQKYEIDYVRYYNLVN